MRPHLGSHTVLDAPHLIALLAATTEPATDPFRVTGARPSSTLDRRDGCGDPTPSTAAVLLLLRKLVPSLPACVASSAPCRAASCSSRTIRSSRFVASLPHRC